jgi:hypothetical protein
MLNLLSHWSRARELTTGTTEARQWILPRTSSLLHIPAIMFHFIFISAFTSTNTSEYNRGGGATPWERDGKGQENPILTSQMPLHLNGLWLICVTFLVSYSTSSNAFRHDSSIIDGSVSTAGHLVLHKCGRSCLCSALPRCLSLTAVLQRSM